MHARGRHLTPRSSPPTFFSGSNIVGCTETVLLDLEFRMCSCIAEIGVHIASSFA